MFQRCTVHGALGGDKLFGWSHSKVRSSYDFLGKKNIDRDLPTGLLMGRVASAKVPEPSFVFPREGLQNKTSLSENKLPMAIVCDPFGQSEGRCHCQVWAFRTGLGTIITGNHPSSEFSSSCSDQVSVFGFDKLPSRGVQSFARQRDSIRGLNITHFACFSTICHIDKPTFKPGNDRAQGAYPADALGAGFLSFS